MNIFMDLKNSPDHQKVKRVLRHPNTFGTVLHACALRAWGSDIYGWEPETIALEFKDEWEVELPTASLDRLCALLAAVSSDAYYRDWAAFTFVNQVLCGHDGDVLEGADPLLVAEAAWGVVEVRLNDSTPSPWGEEVSRYVGVLLDQEGFVAPPAILNFARLPERYDGSDAPADATQRANVETQHARVVAEYLQEQGLTLFNQLKELPWVGEEQLGQLAGEIRV